MNGLSDIIIAWIDIKYVTVGLADDLSGVSTVEFFQSAFEREVILYTCGFAFVLGVSSVCISCFM